GRVSSRPALALAATGLALSARTPALLDQRAIEAFFRVALEGAQTGQGLVEVAALALQLLDALDDALEPEPVLCRAGRIRLVETQILADRFDREPEPPQTLNEGETGAVLIIEDAGAAHARRRDQPAFLVETNALRRQGELVGELGDAIEARTIGWR